MDKKWKEVLEASNNELKSKLKAEIAVTERVDRYGKPSGQYDISVRKQKGRALYFTESIPENGLCYWIRHAAETVLYIARRYMVTYVFTCTLPDTIVEDGFTEVKAFESLKEAKAAFNGYVDEELDYRKTGGDRYEIAQNDECNFQINWADGDCKVFVKIHEIYV